MVTTWNAFDQATPLGTPTNKETWAVIKRMMNQRTSEEIIQEFFWLRKEAVYDDTWEKVIDMINDFTDLNALKAKKVKFNNKLAEIWVTEERFNSFFPNWLPKFVEEKPKEFKVTTKTSKVKTPKAKKTKTAPVVEENPNPTPTDLDSLSFTELKAEYKRVFWKWPWVMKIVDLIAKIKEKQNG